jgi:hypothetical protein
MERNQMRARMRKIPLRSLSSTSTTGQQHAMRSVLPSHVYVLHAASALRAATLGLLSPVV